MSGPYGFEPGGVELAGVELAGLKNRARQIRPTAFDTSTVAQVQADPGRAGATHTFETVPADERWVLGRDVILSFV